MKLSVRIGFLVFCCLLFVACDRPVGVLETEEMANVLTDIHVTEAAIGQQMSGLELEYKRTYYYSIFQKYNITYEDFNRSLEWYSKHPKEFKQVYDITLKQLETKRDYVEHYVYHPEENPQTKHVLDTVDLWTRSTCFVAQNGQIDSLYFELTDSTYFAPGDKFIWTFCERVTDSVQGNLKLRVRYENAEIDSICYQLSQKNTLHRYTVTLTTRDTLRPVYLDGWFFQSLSDTMPLVKVDSVKLKVLFNKERHQISVEQKSALDSLRTKNIRENRAKVENQRMDRSEVHVISRSQFLKMKKNEKVRGK